MRTSARQTALPMSSGAGTPNVSRRASTISSSLPGSYAATMERSGRIQRRLGYT